ncbi:hypothetical protein RHGRI_011386 [Rhododendron griersonianum]|uniref:Uncharacterized protein n=1 Tax=Rhododendron griersonianum TaxID=479676 RepID=A0AAV6KLQ3_9ERIC|nr:hypothetical protein RHGRI_011386 [Rhododendron griersonianum]
MQTFCSTFLLTIPVGHCGWVRLRICLGDLLASLRLLAVFYRCDFWGGLFSELFEIGDFGVTDYGLHLQSIAGSISASLRRQWTSFVILCFVDEKMGQTDKEGFSRTEVTSIFNLTIKKALTYNCNSVSIIPCALIFSGMIGGLLEFCGLDVVLVFATAGTSLYGYLDSHATGEEIPSAPPSVVLREKSSLRLNHKFVLDRRPRGLSATCMEGAAPSGLVPARRPTFHASAQGPWHAVIAYDACVRLCLHAWVKQCMEAPLFLENECALLCNAIKVLVCQEP